MSAPTEQSLLEGRCRALGLDAERVIPDLRGGTILASVALFGDEGDKRWPDHMVGAARAEYALTTPPERCLVCGSNDLGYFGDTPERTDADLTDHWECEACKATGRVWSPEGQAIYAELEEDGLPEPIPVTPTTTRLTPPEPDAPYNGPLQYAVCLEGVAVSREMAEGWTNVEDTRLQDAALHLLQAHRRDSLLFTEPQSAAQAATALKRAAPSELVTIVLWLDDDSPY